MRDTWRSLGKSQRGRAPVAAPSGGASVSAATGGWDAQNPISNMPPENAVVLKNWFPQPGWIELRKGWLEHCDTETGEPVDTLMPYQAPDPTDSRLFAASDDTIFDVTSGTASVSLTPITNPRFQQTMYSGSGGTFLWICNGQDAPQYYDGTSWAAAVITGVTETDIINCCTYRGRIWGVLRDSQDAFYLPLDSIQGAATLFPLGGFFRKGGYLQAIGTWSTEASGATNEFLVFISSYGECAVFLIYDPTSSSGLDYRGTLDLASPIGYRCTCPIGADLAVLTLDGIIQFSSVGNYDEAAITGVALTKNIQLAMTDAARDFSDQFGWQMISYPKGNMAILNVPLLEGTSQEQFVMNTITGAWAQFTGQNANCWAVYDNNAYFGGNDGLVRLADASACDENTTMEFDLQQAYNYYDTRGRNKVWNTARLLVTQDTLYDVTLQVGLSVDFVTNNALDDTISGYDGPLPLWDDPDSKWDEAIWPGQVTISQRWAAVSGIGYCSSLRVKGEVEWSEQMRNPLLLRINSYDIIFSIGGMI